jgi:hypothetical protein
VADLLLELAEANAAPVAPPSQDDDGPSIADSPPSELPTLSRR